MMLPRLLSAAALSAGLVFTAGAQTPEPPPSATTPPAPAVTTPPANPDFEKAIESLRANKIDEALKHLEEACKKDKKLPPPLVILAEIAAQTNNAQAARQLLERASIENPNHPDPFLLSGKFALNEGRLMDAMLCFETALVKAGSPDWLAEQRPRFTKSAREGLAQAYANRNEVRKALTQLQAILEDDKKNAVVRWQVARLLFAGQQPDAALAELKTAHADDPNNVQIGLPETNMARFWDGMPGKDKEESAKHKASAEEWHKKALAAFGKDVKATREYGRWLLNEGRLADADAQLAAAKGLKADDNETKALIGLSHRYKKQFTEAENIFDELNRQDRANPFYAWNLALSMAESADEKKRASAITIAQLVQQGQPKNPEAMSVLGWCFYKAGRYDDSERMLGAALQAAGSNPTPPDTVYFLARILDHRGKGPEARDALKKAVDSKSPFVYRQDAQAFYDDLVKKHGAAKAEDPKPAEPKKP